MNQKTEQQASVTVKKQDGKHAVASGKKNAQMVLNAENMVLGRLASFAAKRAMQGHNIVILNAEKAIITGRKSYVMEKLRTRLNLTVKGNPDEGAPQYSKMPDRVLRSAVRGMVHFKNPTGRDAFKRVRVFIGIPSEFKNEKFGEVPVHDMRKRGAYVVLGDICRLLGAKW